MISWRCYGDRGELGEPKGVMVKGAPRDAPGAGVSCGCSRSSLTSGQIEHEGAWSCSRGPQGARCGELGVLTRVYLVLLRVQSRVS